MKKNFCNNDWYWYPNPEDFKQNKFSNNWINAEKKYIRLLINELKK